MLKWQLNVLGLPDRVISTCALCTVGFRVREADRPSRAKCTPPVMNSPMANGPFFFSGIDGGHISSYGAPRVTKWTL